MSDFCQIVQHAARRFGNLNTGGGRRVHTVYNQSLQDGSMWKRTFSFSIRLSGFMRLRRALPGATRRKAGKPKWIKKKSIDGGSHNDFTIPMPLKLEHQERHANLFTATKLAGG